MVKRMRLLLALLTFALSPLRAQEIDVEKLIEAEVENAEDSERLDFLLNLLEDPLDINTCTAAQLTVIPWISPSLALAVVEDRQRNGRYADLRQLRRIPQLDEATFQIIRHLVTVVPAQRAPTTNLRGRQRLSVRRPLSRGFEQGVYAGGPEKVYSRLGAQVGRNIRLGFLTEKDPGERAWNDLQLGHAVVEWPALGMRICLGDFIMESGQGLVFWGPYRFVGGSDPIAPLHQQARGLVPYTSVSENAALHGVGLILERGPVEIIQFLSRRYLNARVTADSVASLDFSGYHRPSSEKQKRDGVKEETWGGQIEWQSERRAVGLVWCASHFDRPFARPSCPGMWRPFSGTRSRILGCHGRASVGIVNLSGEVARSEGSGLAGYLAAWLDFRNFDLVGSWRRYDPGFQNFHNNAFGENPFAANENGFYVGFVWRMYPGTRLSFYVDQYRRPAPDFRRILPDGGQRVLVLLEQRLGRGLSAQARLKIHRSGALVTVRDEFDNAQRKQGDGTRYNLRFQLQQRTAERILVRGRVEYNIIRWNAHDLPHSALTDSTGLLFFTEVRLRAARGLRLAARWCLFDAPLYDTRFYVYENDLPGVMRLKLLYKRGSRWYLLARWKPSTRFSLSAKYESTIYNNRQGYGSGWDFVDGPYENGFSVQIDWQL